MLRVPRVGFGCGSCCACRVLVLYTACCVVLVRVEWRRVVFRVPCLLSVLAWRVARVVFVACCVLRVVLQRP